MGARGLREEILGSCDRPCGQCGERFHCLNKKALLSPTPFLVWGALAVVTAVPLYMSLNPRAFMGSIAGASDAMEIMDPQDVDSVFGSTIAKIGLNYPEMVTVVITGGIGIGPTSTGLDSRRGGVVFFPSELFALLNPATLVSFPGLYDGPVGSVPIEVRQQLLSEGFLLPTPDQIEFIFGHEVAHLKHKHTFETSKVALSVALLTHIALKANNAAAHHIPQYWSKMAVFRTPVYVSLILFVTTIVTAALSWDQELQADATAARKLGLEDAAIDLKVWQIQQNEALRRSGLPGGEIDLEHPPPLLQMINLKWLRESIRKDKI